jgi:uncharacterized damage-inducible protein DinB
MPDTLQDFLATATQKASDELIAAFLRLPEDKWNWSPADKARTALDQVAECAILGGYTAHLIQIKEWSTSLFDAFPQEKTEAVARGWEYVRPLLEESTRKVSAVISTIPDDALSIEIALPWSKSTLAEIMAYPYWNMTYHQGQINYIASILGCLD